MPGGHIRDAADQVNQTAAEVAALIQDSRRQGYLDVPIYTPDLFVLLQSLAADWPFLKAIVAKMNPEAPLFTARIKLPTQT